MKEDTGHEQTRGLKTDRRDIWTCSHLFGVSWSVFEDLKDNTQFNLNLMIVYLWRKHL
jgi:hypothetical protein